MTAALDTALAYHRAWTGADFEADFEKAMTYIAPDIVCDAPAGRIEGADAFRAFMGPFAQIVRSATLLAAFGDDRTALVLYDTSTVPVASAPGCEHVTVVDGTITHMRIVFDRTPFDAARAATNTAAINTAASRAASVRESG